LYLGLLAGVAEELFFRGGIQALIRGATKEMPFSPIIAIGSASIIFSVFHYWAYNGSMNAFVVMFVVGVVLGVLFEMTNDIGVPMLAHIVNNTFAMLPGVIAAISGSMTILVVFIVVVGGVYLIAAKKPNKRGRRR
jgi:membrane protease YdiL (CAAX protease family)